jgi:hypothetical protein
MKKLSFLFSIALIVSFLVSCKKEDPTPTKATVSGKVLQLNSTIPVPNATVYLYESIWSGGLGGGEFTITKDTTVTNSKGEYSFEYTEGKSSEFFVKAYADDYYTDNNTRWTIDKKNQVRDVIITPYAWISIRVINTPPVNSNDAIKIGGDWSINQGDFYEDGPCDTVFTRKVRGNQKVLVYKWINLVAPGIIDSVYCKGSDTTFHTITY